MLKSSVKRRFLSRCVETSVDYHSTYTVKKFCVKLHLLIDNVDNLFFKETIERKKQSNIHNFRSNYILYNTIFFIYDFIYNLIHKIINGIIILL
jgi:hypothetical protein